MDHHLNTDLAVNIADILHSGQRNNSKRSGKPHSQTLHDNKNCKGSPTLTDPGAIVGIAKEAEFTISAEELQKAQTEINDEQLDGVAGGTCSSCPGD